MSYLEARLDIEDTGNFRKIQEWTYHGLLRRRSPSNVVHHSRMQSYAIMLRYRKLRTCGVSPRRLF